MRQDECKREIIKRIQQLGLRHGHEAAFRDWCECLALALQNGCDLTHGKKWQDREQRYLDIIAKYEADGAQIFSEMSAYLINWLEFDPFQDALGALYMELFASQTKSKTLGQCFTPPSVAFISGETVFKDAQLDGYTISDPLTLNDCAIGGGIMIIGALKALHDRKFDWQHKCKVTCNDIDRLCVHMAYIQLSLIGARAVVLHQDTLTQEVWDVWHSPMELLWPMTLEFGVTHEHPAQTPTETAQISPTLNEKEKDVQTPIEPTKPPKTANKAPKQLTLF